MCTNDECVIITCPNETCLAENNCYTDEFTCNDACGPTNPEDNECRGELFFRTLEEANQFIATIEFPCSGQVAPVQGYCCDNQCFPKACGSNCYYCDTANDHDCSNPISGCEEGKTCVDDTCV